MAETYLARKLNRAKWGPKANLKKNEIPADAISIDLKTTNNKLSFWECGKIGEFDIHDVALALAAARDKVEKLDVVWINESAVKQNGIEIQISKGATPLARMVNKHKDAVDLDYVRLGEIAHLIQEALDNDQFKRFSVQECRYLVKDFGTSKSPKSTRQRDSHCAPAALRPCRFATPSQARRWLRSTPSNGWTAFRM